MNEKERKLWIQALKGDGKAYRKLGNRFMNMKKDKVLSVLCYEKAMELGDEKSFIYYHSRFSKAKKVIDDHSYKEIYREYQVCTNKKKKKRFKQYLKLGTKEQKNIFNCK